MIASAFKLRDVNGIKVEMTKPVIKHTSFHLCGKKPSNNAETDGEHTEVSAGKKGRFGHRQRLNRLIANHKGRDLRFLPFLLFTVMLSRDLLRRWCRPPPLPSAAPPPQPQTCPFPTPCYSMQSVTLSSPLRKTKSLVHCPAHQFLLVTGLHSWLLASSPRDQSS